MNKFLYFNVKVHATVANEVRASKKSSFTKYSSTIHLRQVWNLLLINRYIKLKNSLAKTMNDAKIFKLGDIDILTISFGSAKIINTRYFLLFLQSI